MYGGCLRPGRPWNSIPSLSRVNSCRLSISSRPALRAAFPSQPLLQLLRRALFLVKAAGVGSWPLTSNQWRGQEHVAVCIHSPPTSSWHIAIPVKHRDKFPSGRFTVILCPVEGSKWSWRNGHIVVLPSPHEAHIRVRRLNFCPPPPPHPTWWHPISVYTCGPCCE
jgi:hypothetical protein